MGILHATGGAQVHQPVQVLPLHRGQSGVATPLPSGTMFILEQSHLPYALFSIILIEAPWSAGFFFLVEIEHT